MLPWLIRFSLVARISSINGNHAHPFWITNHIYINVTLMQFTILKRLLPLSAFGFGRVLDSITEMCIVKLLVDIAYRLVSVIIHMDPKQISPSVIRSKMVSHLNTHHQSAFWWQYIAFFPVSRQNYIPPLLDMMIVFLMTFSFILEKYLMRNVCISRQHSFG